jgi:microcystin-dependent protein
MFGYSSYLDKSMNGIKTITDGVAIIQNGNATFNTINVETITSSNLSDCNLTNCTTNDPTAPQSVVNKEYVDDNFVDLTSNELIGGIKTFLFAPFCTISSFVGTQFINKNYVDYNFVDKFSNQTISGIKMFSVFPQTTATIPTLANELIRKDYVDLNFVDNFSNETISGIKTFLVFPQTTATVPTLANELIRKDYVDLNFVDKSTAQIIAGAKNFTNNTQFRGTLTYYDVQTPFTNNSSFFHIGGTSVIRNNVNSGIITYNTRNSTGTAINSFNISSNGVSCSPQLTLNNKLRQVDILTPFSKITESYQNGSILINEQNFNLGSYQFKTRGSTGATTIPLIIDNDGITVFSITTSPIMESSSYRGTTATDDLAIGSTTTTGKILIGTVLNGGELRLGTTLSINNINGLTTFQKIPLVLGTQTPTLDNELITKNYTDGKFIDFTTDQTINATNKRFNGLFTTGLSITPTVGGAGNRQQIYITGTELSFNPLFDNNYYRFYCRNNLSNQINPLEISYNTTTIANNLISNGEGTFNTWVNLKFRTKIYDLTSGTNYTQMYMINGNEFVIGPNANGDKISFYCKDSVLGQLNTFISSATANTSQVSFISNAQATFNNNCPISNVNASSNNHLTTLGFNDGKYIDFTTNQQVSGNKDFTNITNTRVLYTKDFRWNDAAGGSNIFQIYLSGNNLSFVPLFNNNQYSFQCKDSVPTTTTPLTINSTSTTIQNNLISNAQATFNNFAPISNTSPSLPNHLVRKDYVDGMPVHQILNTDNTFTGINTYDNYIISNLGFRLFDVTPSTKYFELSVLGNAMEFVPSFNNNSFEFFTKNSTGTTTIIPLTIEFASTTFNNTIICNYGATFNNSLPTTSLNPTIGTQIVNKNYCDTNFQLISNMGNYVNITTAQTIGGDKTFNGNATYNGGALYCNCRGEFSNLVYLKNITRIYDLITPFTNYTKLYTSGNNFFIYPEFTSSAIQFFCRNSAFGEVHTFISSAIANTSLVPFIASSTATFNGNTEFTGTNTFNNDVLFSADTININGTTSAQDLDFFTSITLGTIHLFSSLSNSLVSMFNYSTNDVTLEINAKVKFRQVKLYNQVKTITGSVTLTFPLEEQIVIRPTSTTYIELPLITANSLGMSFNFITNSTSYAIWFSTQGTDNIIKNGYTTGNSSTVLLGNNGVTALQLSCIELNTGVYSWCFLSSLPERVSNPPGTIITMAVQSTPLGYLACDGGSYSFGGVYSNLYQVIGTTYGSSGLGTFKVPNFNNGSFLRGVGGNSAVIATQQQDNIKTHTHNTTFYRFNNGSGGSHTVIGDLSTGSSGSTVVTSATNTAGSPDETRPINYAVHYCIKY